jgi:ketosteroid isomerase-like protein
MKADATTEAAVKAVLNKMAECYSRRDWEGLKALLAPDPDNVMYGTGAHEKRVGLAEIKAQADSDWSQTEANALEYGWTSISAAGNVAWAAADMSFKLTVQGQELVFPGRLTAVLEKRGSQWLIAQSHFSLPVAGQEAGEAVPPATHSA